MTPNKPYLIGLTGGIACGKSMLSMALKEHGAVVIDADAISRSLTGEGGKALPKIRERFGSLVFDGDTLNRKALGDAVFADEKALSDLNSLMHPIIFEEMNRQIALNADQTAVILEVPLLYETGYDRICDEVWSAWTTEKAQMERLRDRGLSDEEARQRINSQMPAMKKASLADRVIITTGEKAANAKAVIRLWEDCVRRIKRV